jgi:hypothetical protein
MASVSTRQCLASFDIWVASGLEVVYASEVEDDRLREEDEEQVDPALSLSAGQHSLINMQQLKSILPTEDELRALKCARKIRVRWGAQNDDKSPVQRLAEANFDALKSKQVSMRDAYGTPLGAGSPAHFFITKPSASRMKSGCLDPATYRADRVGALDMEGLAHALGVQNWQEKTAFVEKALELHHGQLSDVDVENPWRLRLVAKCFSAFVNVGEKADESTVENRFSTLLTNIGFVLGFEAKCSPKRKFAVGGLLALPNFCVHGVTDSTYVLDGRRAIHARSGADQECTFLTAEFKTDASFPPQNLWYRGTRGVQTLAALWSGFEFNRRAPTLLASQSRYKLLLLVRDAETDALHLYQFPGGYNSGNTRSKEFLKMMALVLLSAHEFSEALQSSPQRPLIELADIVPDERPTVSRPAPESRMVDEISENDGRCAEMGRSPIPFQELSLNMDARRGLEQRMGTTAKEGTTGSSQDLFNWENRVWAVDPADVEEICQ